MTGTTIAIGILEDDAELASYLSEIVASRQWQVSFCEPLLSNSLSALSRTHPDLMIVDLNVPDGSGIDLIEHGAKLGIKSLVYTVFGDEQNVLRAIAAGASGYLLKDSRAEEMAAHIEAAIAGDAPFSPSTAKFLLSALQQNALSGQPAATEEDVLTPKESEVLGIFAKGLTYQETAGALGISRHTVSDHVKSIYKKLGVHSKTEAVFEAHQMGLLN